MSAPAHRTPTHLLLRLEDQVVAEGDARAGKVLQVPTGERQLPYLAEGADHLCVDMWAGGGVSSVSTDPP